MDKRPKLRDDLFIRSHSRRLTFPQSQKPMFDDPWMALFSAITDTDITVCHSKEREDVWTFRTSLPVKAIVGIDHLNLAHLVTITYQEFALRGSIRREVGMAQRCGWAAVPPRIFGAVYLAIGAMFGLKDGPTTFHHYG